MHACAHTRTHAHTHSPAERSHETIYTMVRNTAHLTLFDEAPDTHFDFCRSATIECYEVGFRFSRPSFPIVNAVLLDLVVAIISCGIGFFSFFFPRS